MKLAIREPEITPALIYSKLSDYDIYRYLIGTDFHIGQAFCNPLRRDRNPSMVIYVGQSGHLFHRDYADDKFKGGPFDLVMQAYPGMNYDNALKRVAKDFGISDELSQEYKKITSQYSRPVIDMKRHALIQVSVKKWGKVELDYWGAYGITQEQLKREEVYNVKEWSLNRRKQFIGPRELCFCYRYPEGFQVYYPTRPKGEKWFCNVSTQMLEGWEYINKSDKLLITKSKKDKMYLQSLLSFPVMRTMNESISAFSVIVVEAIKNKKTCWVNFDADGPGKKASYKATELLSCKHLNVPDALLSEGITDFTDWRRARGRDDEIVEFLKQKGLV